jgi:vacuolar-type H+-ATPase subunit E/Vma4
MALDDLIARLDRDGARRVAELRAKADAEAGALLAQAAVASGEHREAELARRRVARQALLGAELAEARQRARADRLRAQRERLAQIFARARALMPSFAASPGYAAALPGHLEEALRFVEGLAVEVACAPAFAPLVRALVQARPGATLREDAALAPGVLVSAADGSVFIDATLPARLSELEPALEVELARALAGPPSEAPPR